MADDDSWSLAEATRTIRSMARNPRLNLTYKLHARERLDERGIIISDVLHALKYGDVFDAPIPATRPGLYWYRMDCKTPNSGSRSIGVVVIPSMRDCSFKIITVMWVDEYARVAGSIIGGEDDQ